MTTTREPHAGSPHRPRRLPVLRRGHQPDARDELARELEQRVRGEVRFAAGDRALYATDASNYRQVPLGVVLPYDVDDVIEAVKVCRERGAPIVSRGGGTSLAGQACNSAVVLDFSKYVNRIIELDPEQRSAWVEPGLVLDTLRDRAELAGLTFGPDPATHDHCTLGGMVGNNSCGVHSMMAGCTAENVLELDVLTYDGTRMRVGPTSSGELEAVAHGSGRRAEIYQQVRAFRHRYRDAIRDGFPDIPRRVSGYDLPALLDPNGPNLARALVGSEGTLATILAIKLRLVPSPPARVLLVLGYDSVFEAADHVMDVRAGGPIGLEGIDEVLVSDMKKKRLHPERVKLLPNGKSWLLAEFGGDDRAEAEERARALMARLRPLRDAPDMKLFDDVDEEAIVWKVRESGLGATARVPGEHDTWEGWEDSAVAPERLGEYLRGLRALLERHHYRAALYGHFGQGCVHTRIPFDLRHRDGIARFRAFVEEASELVVAHGGSLSGEHGDGQSRAELLPKMFSPELITAFERWKAIWDPEGKHNPGKVVRAHRLDDDLRLGAGYEPISVRTHFHFPEDNGSLSYAAERCVGVGECRRLDGGTMCPSYMVTREEKHSTRGRAHLLFEMLRGDSLDDGFRSEPVREALDLCLSCKGCKGECPVNVDMASYKAEFLAHYYRGRLRPLSAYGFGLIFSWARLASWFPALANFVLHAPVLSTALKRLGKIAPARDLPRFARVSFAQWWNARPPRGEGLAKVWLWVDTWSNYFQPSVALAAVQTLEQAGFQVHVPDGALCCGRPLYDQGMLELARRKLRQVLDALTPVLEQDIALVVLEPSCLSVFRDELPNLFPNDPGAQRLQQRACTLADFLRRVPAWTPPALHRKALVQGHCHHKAILGFHDDQQLLAGMGLDVDVLDSGCCGMAGAFGYERAHHAVSMACAERVLLPAVRRAAQDTLIVADGFSCREQIRQSSARSALHTAQLLQLASSQGPRGPTSDPPERALADVTLPRPLARNVRNPLLLLAVLVMMAWLMVGLRPC